MIALQGGGLSFRRINRLCQKLNEKQVEYVDLSQWRVIQRFPE